MRRCGSSAATRSLSSRGTCGPTSMPSSENGRRATRATRATRASRVLLIGMMGVGKSTVGRTVAGRLGWPYVDSDEWVVRHTGKTVPEIFAADGEPAFRAQETAALEAAATSDGPLV